MKKTKEVFITLRAANLAKLMEGGTVTTQEEEGRPKIIIRLDPSEVEKIRKIEGLIDHIMSHAKLVVAEPAPEPKDQVVH